MKTIPCLLLGFAATLFASAAEGVLDLRQTTVSLPSPAVGDTLGMRLSDDAEFSFRIVSAPPAGIAGQSFIARDDASGAAAVVKRDARGFRATIDDVNSGLIWSVRIAPDGTPSVSSTEKGDGPEECATCAGDITAAADLTEETQSQGLEKSTQRTKAGTGFPEAEHIGVVDILVAFDQGAKAKCVELGFDGMDDFADYAVGKMNTVLANSQLDDKFCYRLAGVVEIDGSWSVINNELLLSMRAREGKFAKLSQLRDNCGADTITLLVNRTSGNTSGIGFEYSGNAGKTIEYFDSMNYACNVCDINTVHSRYTMSHETGHNMGCGHSNRQGSNSGPGRYSDSCGYHFTDANNVRRSTVMAYTYTGDDSNYYNPAPYFSTPDISPAEYGCALGVAGVNDNRRTLTLTHADIASLREHVLPYDWDVRFVDDSGRDIPDGAYFPSYYYVTMTNGNPNATIYYTYDDSTPTVSSSSCSPGTRFTMSGSKTITACAVVDGVAQSVRTIHFVAGLTWSGDSNGAGLWLKNDSSVRPWNGEYFYDGDAVMFGDLAGVSCATVTVKDAVAPGSVAFSAYETAYTFDAGDDGAKITIPDANFAPAGDVTFNATVQLAATTFTNMPGCALSFNAPFGQTVDSSGGTFAGMVNIGPYGTLTVAPGVGKTQTLEKLNNVGWYAGTSMFRVGKGTVVFNGTINGGAGVIGRTRLEVGTGGALVFNMGGGTGFDMNNTSLTVEQGGTVTFNDMEHVRRTLYLNGGTIYAKRFDLMSNPGVFTTDDSSIANAGGGYVLIRNSDSEVNVSAGKTLTLNLGTQTDNRGDTSGWGIIKRGDGTLVANGELKHSGVTDIEEGSLEVGYSSGSTVYGLGWIVADGATLKVKSGCSLKVPTLTLDSGATLVLPSAATAALVVTGAVELAGVNIVLEGVGALSEGASCPVLSSSAGLSGVADIKTDGMPALASGLGWTVEEEGGTLYAKVVAAGEKPTVDVLVAFDNGAQAYVGNKGMTLEAFAQTQIGKMNDVLVTNRLDRYYSYRLAGVCKVDGVYNNIDTAPALIAAGAGAAVSLRAARELYGADTVTLLVDVSGNTLGNSSPLNSPNDVASQHECAFSVCSIRAVDTGKQHTMIHENAHNMGCGHARAQSIINSPFPYGRGYYFKDGNVMRHTIMAYGGDNDASWYFSTSSSEFGFALGDATNDNARVLRETCGEVAKWRDGAAVALEGVAPEGVALQTSVRYPWSVDGNGVLRSFNQTTYANQCTTPLRATITGPKTLRFKHKSYFGGTSVAGNTYSHFDVLLDDSPVLAQTEYTNSWTEAQVDVPDGTHEVVFVFSQRFAMNNPSDYKDGTPEADDAVWLKDLVLADGISTVLNIPYGTSTNLSDVASVIETITGEGTLVCDATLPTKGYGLTSETWKGTVAFRNFNNEDIAKDFQTEKYGNAQSKVQFTNCKIPYLKGNNATFAGTVVLDGDSALTVKDGYSANYSIFGALEGNGTMTFLDKPTQWYVFNTATNFTGSINVQHGWYNGTVAQGRRIVFGTTASTQDLPAQSASITVKSGAEVAIGADATWYAYHGVEIAGTLAVKGANATLSCHSDGAMGIKLTGGATLRFDSADAVLACLTNFSFSSGTVSIAFGDGVSPSGGKTLVLWPEGSTAPAGTFVFANSSLAANWDLCKTSTGLIVKPKDRFDVPDTDAYISRDAAVDEWLDDANFGLYDGTWREFMEETGANGYVNWINYVLGLPAADPTAKVIAKIYFDSQGKVVVSVADSIPAAPAIAGVKVVCKLLETDDPKTWPDTGLSSDGKTITVVKASGGRFFRVLIEIQSP